MFFQFSVGDMYGREGKSNRTRNCDGQRNCDKEKEKDRENRDKQQA